MDRYTDFEDLARHETEGVDYVIAARQGGSGIAVIAPHGGGIEPGTADVAHAVAADQHAFAAFKGIKKAGNAVLHLASDRFDEPDAAGIAAQALTVCTIHGCRGNGERVYVGGRDEGLKERIIQALKGAGFEAEACHQPGLEGTNPNNICNRCRSGRGVQIEISRGMREKMVEGLSKRSVRKRSGTFYRFVRALKEAIEA
jgi:phage replication-related protein YjqB (UPF0714/DUF867 family)